MKILQVYKTYFPDNYGGVEQLIKTLAKQITLQGSHTQLLTLSHKPKEIKLSYPNIEVIRYPINIDIRSCPMSYQFFTDFTLQVQQADLIHYHFPWPFADLVHLLKKPAKPTIVTYHSDIVRQRFLKTFYHPLMTKFLQSVDCIVPTSVNYLNSSKVLIPYKEKCRVIPVGLDENEYPIFSQQIVNKWSTQLPANFLLFVGVLRYYKGLHTLLEAAQNTTIPIVIAGTGPLEQKLKEQAQQLGLKNIHFLGYITDEDKVALFSLSRAIVFPSHLRSEAFGITLAEGLMYGKPLISCEIGTGTSFINVDGVTGFVVPPENPVRFREAMLKLYSDANLAQTMGRAARHRYETHFTAQVMGKSYMDVYAQLLGKKI